MDMWVERKGKIALTRDIDQISKDDKLNYYKYKWSYFSYPCFMLLQLNRRIGADNNVCQTISFTDKSLIKFFFFNI